MVPCRHSQYSEECVECLVSVIDWMSKYQWCGLVWDGEEVSMLLPRLPTPEDPDTEYEPFGASEHIEGSVNRDTILRLERLCQKKKVPKFKLMLGGSV